MREAQHETMTQYRNVEPKLRANKRDIERLVCRSGAGHWRAHLPQSLCQTNPNSGLAFTGATTKDTSTNDTYHDNPLLNDLLFDVARR